MAGAPAFLTEDVTSEVLAVALVAGRVAGMVVRVLAAVAHLSGGWGLGGGGLGDGFGDGGGGGDGMGGEGRGMGGLGGGGAQTPPPETYATVTRGRRPDAVALKMPVNAPLLGCTVAVLPLRTDIGPAVKATVLGKSPAA
jgi:hypothetical protein